MNHNTKDIEYNISQTLTQMKITEVPADFDVKLRAALQAERARMAAKATITVMPWQRIMTMAASFLLAITIGLLTTEYVIGSNMQIADDVPQDVTGSVTDDLMGHDKVQMTIIDACNNSSTGYMTSCAIPDYTEVMSAAQVTNMRSDMERGGYASSVGCDSLEECVNYMSENNLDSSQCMVVGYIGETSYVILSNMESIVAGGATDLEGLVGQYEVFSK